MPLQAFQVNLSVRVERVSGSEAKKLCKISVLDEDLLGVIVIKISNPDDRRSFSEGCKQWLIVEGLNRSSLRLLRAEYLHQVLPRFPNLHAFQNCQHIITQNDLNLIAQTCPHLKVFNLNTNIEASSLPGTEIMPVFVGDGLISLANGCPKQSRVMFRGRCSLVSQHLATFLNLTNNVTNLDLGGCHVSDQDLKAIGSWSSISYLNLEGCLTVTDKGLGCLANGSCWKTLKTSILARCSKVTDIGVSLLHKKSCLEYLNLARLSQLTGIGLAPVVSEIKTLKKLDLSRLRKISNRTITALAKSCLILEVIDLSGCLLVNGAGIRAFWTHPCLESLVLIDCEFRMLTSDVEHVILGCPSLNSVVVRSYIGRKMLPQMQENTRKFLRIEG